jgi:DNA (cytosine-5)-methyltransferase 1
MRFYDLFSGIGGFRLGLERSGHKCVGSCEIDKYARQIYSVQFGDKPDGDVRQLHDFPEFDILTAGFPCQAFSIAGKRLGFNDTRGSLFFEIARIAKESRPKILFLENVKGLLNHDRGRTFGTILNTLYELGYDVEWQVINGKYFVPQNRERIFIIGHLRDKPTKQVFPITEDNPIDDKSCTETQGEGERIRGSHTRTIDSNYTKGGGSRTMIKMVDVGSQAYRVYDKEGISPTLIICQGGGKVPMFLMSHTQGNIKQRFQNKEQTWTLDTSNSKMALVNDQRIRKLTPLECERLMGFPDNWTEGVSDTQRYKLLGNSVIVPVIEFIGSKFV